jgi:hypothetical protein
LCPGVGKMALPKREFFSFLVKGHQKTENFMLISKIFFAYSAYV